RAAPSHAGPLAPPAGQARALGAAVGSGVGEPVVEAFVADRRPEEGLDLEKAFPVPTEQPIGRGPVVSHRSPRSRLVSKSAHPSGRPSHSPALRVDSSPIRTEPWGRSRRSLSSGTGCSRGDGA